MYMGVYDKSRDQLPYIFEEFHKMEKIGLMPKPRCLDQIMEVSKHQACFKDTSK